MESELNELQNKNVEIPRAIEILIMKFFLETSIPRILKAEKDTK